MIGMRPNDTTTTDRLEAHRCHAVADKERSCEMHPFSYTSLKIVHDQQIEEVIEQREQSKSEMSLVQMLGKFFSRIDGKPVAVQEENKEPAGSQEHCQPTACTSYSLR